MAYTTINKPSDYFNTKTYTGNGSTQSITGVGFQPDLNWTKGRNVGTFHMLTDAVRGVTKAIQSNTTTAEQTFANGLTSFNSDGFTAGNSNDINGNYNYVSWNWKANGTGSANTDGSISSTVSANTTSGFSIVSYTGNGTVGATIGHGLGTTPKMFIVKNRGDADNFAVYHGSLGATKYIKLNSTDASITTVTTWNDTEPTSSVFSVHADNRSNQNNDTYIAYCFAEKTGYSKFGSYTGNNNADGTFVYTGFKPAFVMTKEWEGTSDWYINDTTRDFNGTYGNVASLLANTSGAEFTSSSLNVDMLSNGFKLRSANSSTNEVAGYIYMAFAEAPLVGTNGVTAKAR